MNKFFKDRKLENKDIKIFVEELCNELNNNSLKMIYELINYTYEFNIFISIKSFLHIFNNLSRNFINNYNNDINLKILTVLGKLLGIMSKKKLLSDNEIVICRQLLHQCLIRNLIKNEITDLFINLTKEDLEKVFDYKFGMNNLWYQITKDTKKISVIEHFSKHSSVFNELYNNYQINNNKILINFNPTKISNRPIVKICNHVNKKRKIINDEDAANIILSIWNSV